MQAPESGGGAGGGAGSCESAQNFFSSPLSLRSQSYKLIWSKKKKIIKKTYKITIEKVILLGEAPLRLHGAFVLFLKKNAVSLPPREYSLLANSLAASWGNRPGGRGHGPGWGSGVPRVSGTQGTQGTLFGTGEKSESPSRCSLESPSGF